MEILWKLNAYIVAQLMALIVNLFPSYKYLAKYEAYTLEPTPAYFVMIVTCVFVTALLSHFLSVLWGNKWTSTASDVHIIKTIIFWNIPLLWLPSKHDEVAIFQTAHNIAPHLTLGAMIGTTVNDLKDLYIGWNENSMSSKNQIVLFGGRLFRLFVNLFILINPVIINVYIWYIQVLQLSTLSRYCVRSMATVLGIQIPKYLQNTICFMLLGLEYYYGFNVLFYNFKNIIPAGEISTLKAINVAFFIFTLSNLWEDNMLEINVCF